MKKVVFVVAVALFAFLAVGGTASAQQVGGADCAGVGYGGVCPDDVERPDDVAVDSSGTLPRTGGGSGAEVGVALALLVIGSVLIGTQVAIRRRQA
jgi:hypothetical protein